MFIRGQLTGQAFKDLLRLRASSLSRPCPKLYFPDAKLFLTRIEFLQVTELFPGFARTVSYPNNGPHEQDFQANRVCARLKFRVASSQLDAQNDPVASQEQEGFVTVALSVTVSGGKDNLSLEVLETDFDALLALVGVGKQEMSDLLAAETIELGLLEQVASLGKFASGRHVDLGYNPALDRVELRVELSIDDVPTVDRASQWSQFYANGFDSITGASAWAMFVDQRIGTSLLKRVLTATIDAGGGFRRDGDVSVRWDSGWPGYRTSVEGELINACSCLGHMTDLDVRLSLDTKLSMSGNLLASDVWVDWKVTDGIESACCILTTVALFPVIGLDLTLGGDVAWYEYLAGLALWPAPILLLGAVLLKMSSVLARGLPGDRCEKDANDDRHLHCELEIPALTEAASCLAPKLTVRAEALEARADGLVLRGADEVTPVVDPSVAVEVVRGLAYRPPRFACNGLADAPERFEAELRVFRTAGTYDFRLCEVSVLGPFKYAAKVDVSEMTCPYSAWVAISIGVSQYDYTPLKVIVTTTHGALHAVIPAAKPVSERERHDATQLAQAQRISRCYAKSRKWDVHWLIDPARYADVARTRQIWSIVGEASSLTTRVDVVGAGGTPIAVADTAHGKGFSVTVVSPTDAMAVVQEARGSAERLEDSDVRGVQTLAGVGREIAFPSEVVAIDVVRTSQVRTVLVHEAEQLTVFELVGPRGDLLRLGALDTSGLEWVGRVRDVVYAGKRGGGVLTLTLGEAKRPRWAVERRPAGRPAESGCACGGTKGRPAPGEASGLAMPPAVAAHCCAFDHLVDRRGLAGERAGRARIEGGRWTAEISGIAVSAAVRRPLMRAADVLIENAAASMLFHVRSGTWLTVGERRRTVEVLRVLARREV